jgi:glycosyltransferase involved in cell wall biosynthesis
MIPRVSVVIPHFERSELLRAAIDSVLRSSAARVEVVVVDDGSSDEEWQKIQAYKNVNVAVIQRRDGAKGPSRCRNLGVHASRGEYIIFLDSDDLMAPWCVEQRLRYAAGAPEADFWIFPVLLFRQAPGDEEILWGQMENGRDSAARFVSGDPPWHTSSPLWRKTALAAIGGFNENVLYGDDSDLHLRALVSGLTPRTFPDAVPDVFVRRSDTPRITNSLTPPLVESRRVRLREGVQFLKARDGTSDLLRAWEAQYFVEAEFLLFNVDDAGEPIELVLAAWEEEFSPSFQRRSAVRGYFSIGLACRRRAYLLLRVARRVAMIILPPAFFPFSGDIAQPTATAAMMEEVRKLMRSHLSQHD